MNRLRRSITAATAARSDRFGFQDLLAEATYGIVARPGRLVLTILGTVLGIASVVVTVGLAQTAAGQINRQFDAAGTIATVDIGDLDITAVPVKDPSQPTSVTTAVVGASAGLLDAVRGQVVTGRFFDTGHDTRADRVVVLGARAAQRLGVDRIDRQPSVFIGTRSYAVIGIIDGVLRRSDLLDALILPQGTARA